MIAYIKEHWIPYLIGATVAVLLGLGLSYFLGVKFSTPQSVREARAAKRESMGENGLGEIDFGDEEDDPAEDAAAEEPAE